MRVERDRLVLAGEYVLVFEGIGRASKVAALASGRGCGLWLCDLLRTTKIRGTTAEEGVFIDGFYVRSHGGVGEAAGTVELVEDGDAA